VGRERKRERKYMIVYSQWVQCNVFSDPFWWSQ